ncbi:MAG: HAD-IIIA family hydrolase [Chitinophagaceae bacterium]|nr:HAD-IIIA family hydrolase [Chitinophagaceae bacterium]
MLDIGAIDNEWTIFLDRDGVINHESPSYIFTPDEFIFYDGAQEAIKIFNAVFKYIIVTTNQRSIGRGLMTEIDLSAIHKKMLDAIDASGGRIDHIYYCTSKENSHPSRKPNPGMALEAIKDYPLIKKEKALIVGNNFSDMEFGRNAGIFTVLVNTTGTKVQLPHPLVDLQFDSLIKFAKMLS